MMAEVKRRRHAARTGQNGRMSTPVDPAVALAPRLPSPLQRVHDERLARRGVELWLKRDDLVHPAVPGNKWRKLAPNLKAALGQGHSRLLTFGGAYSNHIRAVAAAGAAVGLGTVGVIRGDELARAERNWSLARAEGYGMELAFWDRARFRETLRGLAEPETVRGLEERWGRCYVLPEGGTNAAAARGATEIVSELATDLSGLGPGDVVCCAVGTGGTLAGIAAALPEGARALGVAVVKGARYLDGEVARLHEQGWRRTYPNWRIDHDHHGGGYGRVPAELVAFAEDFEARHGLAVERRYVAKRVRCVYDLAGGERLPPGSSWAAPLSVSPFRGEKKCGVTPVFSTKASHTS